MNGADHTIVDDMGRLAKDVANDPQLVVLFQKYEKSNTSELSKRDPRGVELNFGSIKEEEFDDEEEEKKINNDLLK